MLLGIDHLVLATEDPDWAAADLETKLGLAAGGGGRHDAHGTFNRLVWLGDSYLELLGIFDEGLARRSWLGHAAADLLSRGGGLVTWAIAVDDLDDARRWAPPGIDLSDPEAGERRRADGRVVRWRSARPAQPSTTSPFLIEHDPAAAEWTPEERAARQDEQHPVGGRARLAGLDVETASPAVAAGRLRSLLAVGVEPGGRAAVRVRLGPHVVRFVAAPPPLAIEAAITDEPVPAGEPSGAVPRAARIATVDVVADVPLRTRLFRIGDCDIRLRGSPTPVAEPGAEPGAGPHPDAAGGV
jgi:hypothetical protein